MGGVIAIASDRFSNAGVLFQEHTCCNLWQIEVFLLQEIGQWGAGIGQIAMMRVNDNDCPAVDFDYRIERPAQTAQNIADRLNDGPKIGLLENRSHLSNTQQFELFPTKIWMIHLFKPTPRRPSNVYSLQRRGDHGPLCAGELIALP